MSKLISIDDEMIYLSLWALNVKCKGKQISQGAAIKKCIKSKDWESAMQYRKEKKKQIQKAMHEIL